jgi:hypothetical protein
MLHRLKLQLLYGHLIRADKAARKAELRFIVLSGFAVYLPFLVIAYFVHSETGVAATFIVGILSALTCIPISLYAYAKGFGVPLPTLFRERRREREMVWLSIKIGFFYSLFLYFMIFGIVEFLFGYKIVRAGMISFVASAVARDGFEIGYYRARSADQEMDIFPDGQSIVAFLKSDPISHFLWLVLFASLGGLMGFFGGVIFDGPIAQTLFAGTVIGMLTTLSYKQTVPLTAIREQFRFFLWPGFTMAVTYFLTLLYLYRIMLKIEISPAFDLAMVMAICSGWLTLETRFVGHLKSVRGTEYDESSE